MPASSPFKSPVTPRAVDVVYPSRRVALRFSRAEGATLSLFVPTPQRFSVGEPVALEISFGDCDQRFHLVGKVVFHRAEVRGLDQPLGIGVSFRGADKRGAAHMIAICAGRPPSVGTAARERVPADIGCLVRLNGRRVAGRIADLSSQGAFVALTGLRGVRAGMSCVLQLNPRWFGLSGPKLQARVIWQGEKQGRAGFGARFTGSHEELRPLLKFLAA